MIIETTPEQITEEIIKLCKEINDGGELLYVSVESEEWCDLNECFINVAKKVNINQGRQVNGWAIWQWANRMIEAEAHSVWENDEGKLIDITPHDRGEKEILFLRDESVIYTGKSIPSRRVPLSQSPLVCELIKIRDVIDKYKCNSVDKEVEIPAELLIKVMMIQIQMNQKAKGYEPCPCQSGLKYKKCCGKYEKKD